ncbi:MAG: hypothetical protein BWK75_04700 [Candidatus Altiarchaeales archaeon A3]|nr:MAG: hypothetical protein BWK75_04700 [Candidatus Altiarchaeales archaeon A3]
MFNFYSIFSKIYYLVKIIFKNNEKINSIEVKRTIEIEKKIEFMASDIEILQTKYERLLSRERVVNMVESKIEKKGDDEVINKIMLDVVGGITDINTLITRNPRLVEILPRMLKKYM